jgi:hypothetical protein
MMRPSPLHILPLVLLASPAGAQVRLSSGDQAAAFRAAGFSQVGRHWRSCEDPGTAGYSPGRIEQVEDLNGDGRPEAIISEGSAFCYGRHEVGFSLVSKQTDSSWRAIFASEGIAHILPTRGSGGWPDIEIRGPGFCFPVRRWNGAAYEILRFQYEGTTCTP